MYLVVCLSRNNAVLVCTYEAYFTVQYTVSIVDEVYTIPIVWVTKIGDGVLAMERSKSLLRVTRPVFLTSWAGFSQ